MMVWGGLLYLAKLDLATVFALSRERNRLISDLPEFVQRTAYRYVRSKSGSRSVPLLMAGLHLYRLLGLFKQPTPVFDRDYPEASFLRNDAHSGSVKYEEAVLRMSDSRFVLSWITPHQSADHVPLNYCAVVSGGYSPVDKLWRLECEDRINGSQQAVQARLVINCAGVWADRINQSFSIESPYRHAFSKGVYLGIVRPAGNDIPLIFDMGQHGDSLTLVPFGPVSLWGPTETLVTELDSAFTANAEDVRFLLDHANRHLALSITPTDVISLRVGVRPLAVKRTFTRSVYPLELSRKHVVVRDRHMPWITAYGGKITSARAIAADATRLARATLPRGSAAPGSPVVHAPPVSADTIFPGIDAKFPAPRWCVEHEFCCTLEDFLRRRTAISQWAPREGLGTRDEHRAHVLRIARQLYQDDALATQSVERLAARVAERFDRPLALV
jgi:glycerol-3-phosphate dehydrogenase